MVDWIQFKSNVIRSFRVVKQDVYTLDAQVKALQVEVRSLHMKNLELATKLAEMNIKKTSKRHKSAVKRVAKTKQFVASKTASKFHSEKCAFAKNIKPKNKLTFASKNTAKNKGFKTCACVE